MQHLYLEIDILELDLNNWALLEVCLQQNISIFNMIYVLDTQMMSSSSSVNRSHMD